MCSPGQECFAGIAVCLQNDSAGIRVTLRVLNDLVSLLPWILHKKIITSLYIIERKNYLIWR